MSKDTYNESSIQIKKDIEHVRARPAMYIQDTGQAGLHHLSKEIIDNCIDEFLAGHCTRVRVKLDTKTGTVYVTDNGRGIPVEKHTDTGRSTLEAVFTITGAGGKFDKKSYHTSAGTHGVGSTVVNALSEAMKVSTWRNGKCYSQTYKRGKPTADVEEIKEEIPKGFEKGTRVVFRPDYEQIFRKVKIDPKYIEELLSNLSYLCPGLRLALTIDKNDPKVFLQEKGLEQYIRSYLKKDADHSKAFTMEEKDEAGNSYDIALLYTDDYDESEPEVLDGFVNCSITPEGGTHIVGVRKAITKALSGYTDKPYDNEDLRIGLIGAVHAKVGEPEFKGQTKDRLGNEDIEDAVFNLVLPKLKIFFDKHQALAKGIVERAIKNKLSKEKLKKEQQGFKNVITVKKTTRGVLPGKLAEAPNCKPEDRELYICLDVDTEVLLVDGTSVKIKDMVGSDKKFYGFTYNTDTNLIEPCLLEDARLTRKNADMVKVNLDNNSFVQCTPDHTFLAKQAHRSRYDKYTKFIEAENLPIGQSLVKCHITGGEDDYMGVKVINIEKLPDKKDAYCLTVKDTKNFALASGIFVHNCEGESAAGTAIMARDSKFQEVLQLKGKIPNATRTDGRILSNDEIKNIILAVGANVKTNCDVDKARVGKVIFLTDGDPDGCFSGDTRIRLLDGTSPTLFELTQRKEPFWVYSVDKNGKVVPGKAHSARKTKTEEEYAIIELDTGEKLCVTLDHLFLIKDPDIKDKRLIWKNSLPYIKASELKSCDHLFPLYTKEHGGYLILNGSAFVHHIIWKHFARDEELDTYNNKKSKNEWHIHHEDDNKLNNNPDNLKLIHGDAHRKLHGSFGNWYNGSEKQKEDSRKAYKEGKFNTDGLMDYNKKGIHAGTISKKWEEGIYNYEEQKLSKIGRYYASLIASNLDIASNWDLYLPNSFHLYKNVSNWEEIKEAAKKWKGNEYVPVKRLKSSYPTQMTSKFVRVAKQVLEAKLTLNKKNYEVIRYKKIGEGWDRACKWDTFISVSGLTEEKVEEFIETYNHTIKTVEIIKGESKDFYDMTVEEHHNFALDSGVFVHNSHIAALLLAFFAEYMPEVIKEGMVYSVNSPLFIGKYKDQRVFGMTAQEVKAKFPTGAAVIVSRLKGHGEADSSELKFYAMDKKTRKLWHLSYEDDHAPDIMKVMGADSSFRKVILGLKPEDEE